MSNCGRRVPGVGVGLMAPATPSVGRHALGVPRGRTGGTVVGEVIRCLAQSEVGVRSMARFAREKWPR